MAGPSRSRDNDPERDIQTASLASRKRTFVKVIRGAHSDQIFHGERRDVDNAAVPKRRSSGSFCEEQTFSGCLTGIAE